MPGIGIISNPNSRRNRRHPEQMRRLAYVLGKDDVDVTTKSIDDVDTVARRFRDAEIDILALNGGDGTNHVSLSSFIRVYGDQPLPLIALLRGGTMNTISNAIGITGTPNALLVNIVEKHYLEQPFEISERDLLKVTDDMGPSYGFIFGTGVVSNFLSMYYDTGHPSPGTAVVLIARALLSALVRGPLVKTLGAPVSGQLIADGELWESGEYLAVAASTIDQIGLGFRPFIRCEAKPGFFHVVTIKSSPLRTFGLLPRLRMGKPLLQKDAPDTVAKKLVFESEAPIEYTIDGDLHRSGKSVTLETGPRLRIIVK